MDALVRATQETRKMTTVASRSFDDKVSECLQSLQRDAKRHTPGDGHHSRLHLEDDVRIEIDDVFSIAQARKMVATLSEADAPPAAMAMLSPGRRAPITAFLHDEVEASIGARLSFGKNTPAKTASADDEDRKEKWTRHSSVKPHRAFATDVTNSSRYSTPGAKILASPQPAVQEPSPLTVPFAEYLAVCKERDRAQTMYEHQRSVAEAALERHAEDYGKLQQKIVEVVGLTSRLEESKRFIRQIKAELKESRTRTLPLLNTKVEIQKEIDALADSRCQQRMEAMAERFEEDMCEAERRIAVLEEIIDQFSRFEGESTSAAPAGGAASRNYRRVLFHSFMAVDAMKSELKAEKEVAIREGERRRKAERLLEDAFAQRRELEETLDAERRLHLKSDKRTAHHIRELQTAVADSHDRLEDARAVIAEWKAKLLAATKSPDPLQGSRGSGARQGSTGSCVETPIVANSSAEREVGALLSPPDDLLLKFAQDAEDKIAVS